MSGKEVCVGKAFVEVSLRDRVEAGLKAMIHRGSLAIVEPDQRAGR